MTQERPARASRPNCRRVALWLALAFALVVVAAGLWLRSSAGEEWLQRFVHSGMD